MNRPFDARSGVTLLELVVALAIIGIAATLVTLSWDPIRAPDTKGLSDLGARIADARRRATSSGRTQLLRIRTAADSLAADRESTSRDSVEHEISVHADGTVVADSALHVDRLRGRLSIAGRTHE